MPSYPQYLAAAAAARRVGGVTGVHNHLEVALPEGDYRDDVKLATATNNALAQNVTVPDNVEATAEDGNITWRDRVYGTERAAAEAAVAGLTVSATSATTSISPTLPTRSTSTCTSGRPWTALRWSRTAAKWARTPRTTSSR